MNVDIQPATAEPRFWKIGVACLLLFTIVSLLAGWIAPHSLTESFMPFSPPSWSHPLGTNDMGFDIFSELLHSGRISLTIGIIAALVSSLIGVLIGMLSGYLKGLFGELMVGMIDLFLLIPTLPLMIILASQLGPSIWNIVFVISILGWCSTARAVRAKTLQLREQDFVTALVALDIPTWRIILLHLFPNVLDIVSAKFVVSVAGAMLVETSLSFLGLGDPSAISWGSMMHFAFKRGGFANGMWTWYLPPGLCVAACAVSFILIGMSLERRDSGKLSWF